MKQTDLSLWDEPSAQIISDSSAPPLNSVPTVLQKKWWSHLSNNFPGPLWNFVTSSQHRVWRCSLWILYLISIEDQSVLINSAARFPQPVIHKLIRENTFSVFYTDNHSPACHSHTQQSAKLYKEKAAEPWGGASVPQRHQSHRDTGLLKTRKCDPH